MPIRITKPATIDPHFIGVCPWCGCQIECLKQDILYEDRPCAVGYVKCPTEHCGGHIEPKPVDRRNLQ